MKENISSLEGSTLNQAMKECVCIRSQEAMSELGDQEANLSKELVYIQKRSWGKGPSPVSGLESLEWGRGEMCREEKQVLSNATEVVLCPLP